jgi:hypothetical protein
VLFEAKINFFQDTAAVQQGKPGTGEELVILKVGKHKFDFSPNQKRRAREYAFVDQVWIKG